MRLLARSEICPIQACELEGKPVFGVQFHPERPLEAGERSLAKRIKENPKADCANRGTGREAFRRESRRDDFPQLFLHGEHMTTARKSWLKTILKIVFVLGLLFYLSQKGFISAHETGRAVLELARIPARACWR